jgi:GMP synthase (glutamine-hydrolysing)
MILSGGPASVYAEGAPKMDPAVLELGIPILGFCYGMQLMALRARRGRSQDRRRRVRLRRARGPRARVRAARRRSGDSQCWMSHRDSVGTAPAGFTVTARPPSRRRCDGGPGAQALRDAVPSRGRAHRVRPGHHQAVPARHRGHPSAVDDAQHHRRDRRRGSRAGRRQASSAACPAASTRASWPRCCTAPSATSSPASSSTTACCASTRPSRSYASSATVPRRSRARRRRGALPLAACRRHRPREEAPIIGEEFWKVFFEEATKLEGVEFLAQGTLYPDVIESGSKTAAKIKSHHNLIPFPEGVHFDLIEPLRRCSRTRSGRSARARSAR